MTPPDVGLPEALERAASALDADADAIRPANGDPSQLLRGLDAEAATRVLAWLLEHVPAAGAELAAAWAEEPDAGAAPILAIPEEGLPKPARKTLRRARHQLRSRGVAVEVAPRVQVVASLPPTRRASRPSTRAVRASRCWRWITPPAACACSRW